MDDDDEDDDDEDDDDEEESDREAELLLVTCKPLIWCNLRWRLRLPDCEKLSGQKSH